jgi:predicted ribosomally synthesized peptide with nif11-like leader
MSTQLTAFLKAVQSNPDLLAKLNATNNPNEIVAIANDAGFSLSTEELSRADSVVTENELESIAGGLCWAWTSTSDCESNYTSAPMD